MFILDILLLYSVSVKYFVILYAKIIIYFHRARCRFYVFISMQTKLYVPIWEIWYDKIFKIHDKFQNINFNVVFY